MLTDYWIVALLVGQTCAFVLMASAVFHAGHILRTWRKHTYDETQLWLERKSYLVDVLLRVVLSFQVLSLVLFLFTINYHLPPLIEGAMCGTGTLALNEHGYKTLFIKIFAIFIYLLFLFTQSLDESEPESPLTPIKYIFVFPALLLMTWEGVLMTQYFAGIDPDVIATCCSVSDILATDTDTSSFLSTGAYTYHALMGFVNLAFVLGYLLYFSGRRYFWHLLIGLVYVGMAAYSLKYFFVKYIYGLPSHTCLFDLFFVKYYGVGFLIFGSYFVLIGSLLFLVLIRFFRPILQQNTWVREKRLRYLALFALSVSFVVPVVYWLLWEGIL
ncbi:MAG: hypothetical protein ACFCUI_13915 [Bernardetiaceae bacterium]